jgi:transcription-repair coupling factor (superfamily II helicase)
MEERRLENNVMQFYRGESDLLLSTTIIENGIDLPKANTLIVIDADRLGLSSLYQLKGRVGRSDRLAYAYFTYKRDKILTSTAQERLSAIVEFAEMGSGIKIAMRDLEIRGAGNILGAEQHGHMDKIGYELYSKLLREELSGKDEPMPELDIRVTAYIPDDYVESNASRMDIYKQIAEIDSEMAVDEIISSLKEVYGAIPEETLNLIDIAIVKRLASKLKVKEIEVTNSETALIFGDYTAFSNPKLLTAIDCFGSRVKICMSGTPKLEFTQKFASNAGMLKELKEFLLLALK